MNRIRSIVIARGASNPGISSGVIGDGEAIGVSAGDTSGEGVTAGVSIGIGVEIEVANFSFHALIPPSML